MANNARLGIEPSINERIAARTPLKEASRLKKAATPREVRFGTRREARAPMAYDVNARRRNSMDVISSLLWL
jgi:hypothetical protein